MPYKNGYKYFEKAGAEIYDGEECIENLAGKCLHYDCYYGIRSCWSGLDMKLKLWRKNFEEHY